MTVVVAGAETVTVAVVASAHAETVCDAVTVGIVDTDFIVTPTHPATQKHTQKGKSSVSKPDETRHHSVMERHIAHPITGSHVHNTDNG